MQSRRRGGLVTRIVRGLALPALLAAAVGGAPLSVAHAVGSTITVDTLDGGTADGAGAGDCSLAEAIHNANVDAGGTPYLDCALGSADDTINFSVAGTITLTAALPAIDDPQNERTTIDGGGDIVVDGNGGEVMDVLRAGALRNLTVQNASDGCCSGAAIYVQSPNGNLDVVEALFYNNEALGTAGAILNAGTLTVNASTFTSNSATAGGGAIDNSGTAVIANSTFYNNDSSGAAGGAIRSTGTLTLLSSTISQSSSFSGGAVHIVAGSLNVVNSILANSTSGTDCGEDGGQTMGVSYSLVENDGCGLTDGLEGNIVGEDPMLGYLAGTPAYFVLKPASPVIDAGTSAQAYGAFDQPGNARLVDIPWAPDTGDDDGTGTIIDMGAYEYYIYCPGGARFYVDQDVSGGVWGTSWADAFPDLQMALHAIEECSTPTEVWVAEGLYKPDAASPGAVSSTFNIPPGAQVYGGFDGTETVLSEQDWITNVTVMSGDVDDNDDTDLNGVVLQVPDQNGNNATHVATMDGTTGTPVTSSTVLDGFTITGGTAVAGGNFGGAGAGLLCNGAGAAHECSPTLADLHFRGNRAGNGAGAFLCAGSSGGVCSAALSGVSFFYNQAPNGAAMTAYGWMGTSHPVIQDAVFAHNNALATAGALYIEGSGGAASPDLDRVVFSENAATGDGGAIYCDGTNGTCSPTLTDVTFEANTAGGDGGAMYIDAASGSGNPVLVNVTFAGNSANGAGGAMYNDGSSAGEASPDIHNSTFQGNGGAIVGDGTEDGGAIYNNGDGGVSSPTLIHVTISGNEANITGGGIYNSAQSFGSSNGWVVNSIVYGNTASTGAQIQNALGTPTILASAIQDSFPGSVWDSSLGTDGGGNTAGDPMLAALANNGGFTETMALLAGSSALDTADDDECLSVTDDQRGVTRPQGPHCDMGAFEVGTVTISGNAAVAGAELSYDDDGPQIATADGSGNYNFDVPANWSGTVTPALPHYFFLPASLSYANLFDDQINQDYTAVPYVKFAPDDGATVCRQPTILVKLMLSDLTRTGAGVFNAATVTFEVDNVSVLGQAVQRVPPTAPNSWAHLTYKPTSDLALGAHTVEFTHPETTGTITDTWSLTAANIACTPPVLLSAPAETGTEQAAGTTRQLQSSAAAQSGTRSTVSAPQASTGSTLQAQPNTEGQNSATSGPALRSGRAAPQARSSIRATTRVTLRGVPHPGLYRLLLDGQR